LFEFFFVEALGDHRPPPTQLIQLNFLHMYKFCFKRFRVPDHDPDELKLSLLIVRRPTPWKNLIRIWQQLAEFSATKT